MKNLANCKPSEFLMQTNKIRKVVAHWLDVTKILEIRQKHPKFESGMTKEEKDALIQQQAMQNLNDVLDEALEKHPEDTLNILACVCFIEPENVDDYPVSDYLQSISEILSNQAVLSFFTSLAQLDQMSSSSVQKV